MCLYSNVNLHRETLHFTVSLSMRLNAHLPSVHNPLFGPKVNIEFDVIECELHTRPLSSWSGWKHWAFTCVDTVKLWMCWNGACSKVNGRKITVSIPSSFARGWRFLCVDTGYSKGGMLQSEWKFISERLQYPSLRPLPEVEDFCVCPRFLPTGIGWNLGQTRKPPTSASLPLFNN